MVLWMEASTLLFLLLRHQPRLLVGVLVQRLRIEPGLENLMVVEDLRLEEVEQRPELVEVVLERCAGEQQPVVRAEVGEDGGEAAFLVLDPVALVHHHVAPGDFMQHGPRPDRRVVGGDEHLADGPAQGGALNQLLQLPPHPPRPLHGVEEGAGHGGGEPSHLFLPIGDGGEWRHHQEGPRLQLRLVEVAEEGDGLQGLA